MTWFGKEWLRYGPWVYATLFGLFCLAFYLPLSSKAINNIFYAGLALPCLGWLLLRPAALIVLVRPFGWLVILLVALVALDAGDAAGLKKALYLLLFCASCLLLQGRRWDVQAIYDLCAWISLGILVFIALDWLWIWLQTGKWVRYGHFLGVPINPVHFSLLISNALIFLWLFRVADLFERRSPLILAVGLLLLGSVILLCATIFQSRSAVAGFILFFFGYLLYRRMFLLGLAVLLLLVALLYALGGDELLLRRGFSYRLDIWLDAGSRLVNQCGVWFGCGIDEYRFLGRFEHPHSGYFAMLYRNGLLGGLLFSLFALLWLHCAWRFRSRWLLLALLGWGSLLTTSNGVLTSPQPLWIYFWLPVFMAVVDSQRGAVREYFQSRCIQRSAQS